MPQSTKLRWLVFAETPGGGECCAAFFRKADAQEYTDVLYGGTLIRLDNPIPVPEAGPPPADAATKLKRRLRLGGWEPVSFRQPEWDELVDFRCLDGDRLAPPFTGRWCDFAPSYDLTGLWWRYHASK